MRSFTILLMLVVACADPAVPKEAPSSVRIQRSQIEEMFNSMREKPGWDLDAELVWDYFFTDMSKSRLAAVVPLLEAKGYEIVEILSPAPEDDDQTQLYLQVRKTEHHTVDSLLERNAELYDFAEENELKSYDGMDMSRREDF